MRLATWNLNNRVGRVRFRPEATHAAIALKADVMVFTEYFPQEEYHQQFCRVLEESGWVHQVLSLEPPEIANRTLIASRLPLERDGLALPDFDYQFPGNIVAAHLPTLGLRILGLRVPWYTAEHRIQRLEAWNWLERAAASLCERPAVILGDLNIPPSRGCTRRGIGACFQRILDGGWQRAAPAEGYSYFGRKGRSEIDHILATLHCTVSGAHYVTCVPGFTLAGTPQALSDHAALVADIDIGAAAWPALTQAPTASPRSYP